MHTVQPQVANFLPISDFQSCESESSGDKDEDCWGIFFHEQKFLVFLW